jgi:hypothetical protein
MPHSISIRLLAQTHTLYSLDVPGDALPFEVSEHEPINANDAFAISVSRRPDGAAWRVRLGSEVIWSVSARPPVGLPTNEDEPDALAQHIAEVSEMRAWLRNEVGESVLNLELEQTDGTYRPIFRLPLQVTPRPGVYRDFVAVVEDMIQVHAGLVQDVVGRAWISQGLLGETVNRLQPDALMTALESLYERVSKAVTKIACQPSRRLIREPVLVRYRGGDQLDHTSIASLMRSRGTQIDQTGTIRNLGKVRLRRPTLTDDIPEHRHIAAELRKFSMKAQELSQHCLLTADELQLQEKRWGATLRGAPSVYEQVHLPRVEAYRHLAEKASEVSDKLKALVHRYRFLSPAEPPRTSLEMTPLFQGRADYREVYRAIIEARRQFGILLDEHAMRVHYKDFPTLYEMWCLLRVVRHLNHRLGTSSPSPPFAFSDQIFHPHFPAGQRFVYMSKGKPRVEVCYERDFWPMRLARHKQERWAAAFTSEPLRPDICITIEGRGRQPVILVLDAKSTDSFSFSQFRSMADYSRQIFSIRNQTLPVKQVFLLHRDRTRTSPAKMTNIPFYLKGKRTPDETTILGAVPVVPGEESIGTLWLERVLDLFLAKYGETPLPESCELFPS